MATKIKDPFLDQSSEAEEAYAIENRMKNLLWTISGDYDLDVTLDLNSFKKSRFISMLDAIKQGSFAKYYSLEELSMYIVRKIYAGADQRPLMEISQLCVESASLPKVDSERGGVDEIRRNAYRDMLEKQLGRLAGSFFGQARIQLMREYLRGTMEVNVPRLQSAMNQVRSCAGAADTMEIIRTVDRMYNMFVDKSFEREKGTLEEILAISMEELQEFNWKDFLDEESLQDVLARYHDMLSESNLEKLQKNKQARKNQNAPNQRVQVMDDQDLQKIYKYIQNNHGISYLTLREQEDINFRLCRGAHENCSLYYTDGILHSRTRIIYQHTYAEYQLRNNKLYYRRNKTMIERNIQQLTEALRKALMVRNEDETYRNNTGVLVPNRLWKVGRTDDVRLFDKIIKKDTSDFVIDILVDSSGSQISRSAQVASQAYIISEALSNLGIPHAVFGFCSYWDYTIMRRFRSYDDDRDMNRRIFEFFPSGDNRDGIAIRSTYDTLIKREEKNKVLIILSDGRPNNQTPDRRGVRPASYYEGDAAVKDTATEIRRARSLGISVLGVFAGEEEDLAAEKLMYGKDFAYIRNLGNFANVVSVYLKRQIEEDL